MRREIIAYYPTPRLAETLVVAPMFAPCITVTTQMHPYLNNEDLLQWCNGKGIHVTAYAPLGNVNPDFASALADPVIAEIAERKGKSPAQVSA